ncbi:hypothetical protein NBRC10512_004909 [Rhodotorula toruloides]|uniref:RHTO0S01e12530g1_1 n=2 Tax=Rhodotorula toruloides TaxID=5286 RepID=A0A061AL39_RHOTO|nr:uncharacterized protein RHTO_04702 [Rhodotorula toruloides NP11]EMS24523.1 hypothetical protein RHTO_04702 [Rhodotorula toruloides NP11]CDR36025.1 RHTO0S01e12530g1_1 [Rhodotorula toruloides]
MSHLDAPLRSRRQHPSSDVFLRREAGVITSEDTFPPLDLDDSSSPSSSSSFAASTRSLRSLLLPAQVELRRVFHRQRRRDLPSNETDTDERAPKRFKTDSSFHIHRVHHLHERQTRTSTTTAQLGAALSNVGTGTDCQAFADRYGDGRRTQVLLGCARAKAAAVTTSQEASSSRAAAAASTSTSRRIRTSTTTSRRSTRTSTAPRDAATPRLAAPVATPLSPAQASALSRSVIGSVVSEQFSQAASVVASRVSVASASRAVLMSSVDSIFSEAASVVASRQGLLPTVTSASSASTASSSSTSSSAPSSASSISSTSSSSVTPSSTANPARSNHNRIAKIVGPSVAVPLGLLLLALLLFCCLKRRRRKTGAGYTTSGRSTPGGLGPISHPQPLQPAAGGAMREYGAMGAGAGLAGLGAAAAAGAGGRTGEPGSSQESLGPTPSAIGVAFSEPRTKWGRRSLVDVLAGGVRGANSGSNTPEGSAGDGSGGHQRGLSTSSSFGGRQPSIRSSASIPSELRGVGGYNIYGYQPGQPRPVMSMTSPLSSHYDPFGPGAIVPVPESATSMHPVSSEEGLISGYSEGPGGSGSGGGRSGSGESFTAVLAPPLAAGYAHSRQAQQSRTTQQTSEGEQEYWTADAGQSSVDTHTQEAGDYEEAEEELSGSPQEEAVNFGSGSSSSGSGAGSRMSEDPNSTPRLGGSRTSTPRLGMGHGSIGSRRNDGTGSWWNA